MTENLAARGEGLAGLVAKWEEIAEHGTGTPMTDSFQFRCAMERCAAELKLALEAAAPASTAHGLFPLTQAPQRVRWTVEQNGRSERILCRWYEKDGIQLKREVAVFCDWNAAADMKWDEEDLVCTMNDYPRALAKSISVPAATQEQPAGSGASKPVRLEQPLRKLREVAGELDASNYVTGQKATAKLIRQCVDEIINLTLYDVPGSPRKVGEDGVIAQARLEEAKWWYSDGELLCRIEEVSAAAKFVLSVDGYSTSTVAQARRIVDLEQALARSSSVPVGEQKQEEGV